MTHILLQSARAATVVLVAVFCLAVIHKVGVLLKHAEASEPLLGVSAWRQKHARPLLFVAMVLEVAVVASLLLWSVLGAAGSALITGAYWVEIRRLPDGARCNCLGAMLNLPSRQLELGRNVALGVIAVGVTVIGLTIGPLPSLQSVSQYTIGSVILLIAVGSASLNAIGRGRAFTRTPPRTAPPTSTTHEGSATAG